MNNIVFTREAAGVLKEKLRNFASEDIFILVDNNSRNYCLESLNFYGFPKRNLITIPDGEHHKTLESVSEIWRVLSNEGARRNSVLVNLGGGLVTDVGGFAASCFKRGMKCINIPTTLLAQVDASVGGKTGINFRGFKNEIGTFSIPECVIIDNRFLNTLPQRQIMSGIAEMLKHALLDGEESLKEIIATDLSTVCEEQFLTLIEKSVKIKAAIVESDPCEKGIRKALNLGHTIGHAIESVGIEREMNIHHGDAVAYGMIAELYLSTKRLGLESKYFDVVREFVHKNYPHYRLTADDDELYELMLHDKKNEQKGVNFTLLRAPGQFEIDNYCSKNEIAEAMKMCCN